ncbi:alpha-2-macroglobulin family protein [Filimonas lacunae]|nr:MG2 domain-containing protein [Filimonas lacunae]BAV07793.1 outer membrane protein, nutrient binding [Filimonas lacunae]
MKVWATLLLLIGLCLPFTAFLQEKKPFTWERAEEDIRHKNHLQVLDSDLQLHQQQAARLGNWAVVGRCMYYHMQVKDLTTEDTLFFKNMGFADSVLQNAGSPAMLKMIMHVLKAQRIYTFKQQFFHRHNKILFRGSGDGIRYGMLEQNQLDSLAQWHLDSALVLSKRFGAVTAASLVWLIRTPLILLFPPSTADIMYVAVLEGQQQAGYPNFQVLQPNWLTLSPDAFVALPDSELAQEANAKAILHTYKEWMLWHKEDKEVYYYIESLLRKYVSQHAYSDSATRVQYKQYLQTLVQSSNPLVKVHGVYQQTAMLYASAAQYNPLYKASSRVGWGGYAYYGQFDTAYRWNLVIAKQLYQQHQLLIDSFPYIRQQLLQQQQQAAVNGFSLDMHDTYKTGEDIPVFCNFRNAPRLYVKIVNIYANPYPLYPGNKDAERQWAQAKPVWDTLFSLPAQNDYQWHNMLLKFPALPAGHYAVMYSDSLLSQVDSDYIGFAYITVTNLILLDHSPRWFVFNRTTTAPQTNAVITYQDKTYPVNKDGSVTLTYAKEGDAYISIPGDTLVKAIRYATPVIPDKVYDKEAFDNPVDYHKDQMHLMMYTDRAIYRPGQKVYFKGLVTTRNPQTGEVIVFSRQNVGAGLYKKIFRELSEKTDSARLLLLLNDAFSKQADSVYVSLNEFGSFAGSFQLPAKAATGEWQFDVEESIEIEGENFKVEEYKRPDFTLSIEKPKQFLQLKDSFAVTVKVRSFAGAALANVPVNYKVTRYLWNGDQRRNDKVAAGDVTTNEKGEYVIKIIDTAIQTLTITEKEEVSARYSIEAEAVDVTGESHEENSEVTLSSRPVKLSFTNLSGPFNKAAFPKLAIKASSDFAGSLQRNIQVRIYRQQIIKEPAYDWVVPVDVWIYPQVQWQQWFPQISTAAVSKTVKEPEEQLLLDTVWETGSKTPLAVPQHLLQTGKYRIEAVCIEKGHTAGTTSRLVEVYDQQAGTFVNNNDDLFYHLPKTAVVPGEQLHLLTGHADSVLHAVYHLAWLQKSNKGTRQQNAYYVRKGGNGIQVFNFTMPQNSTGRLQVTLLYLTRNGWHKKSSAVFTPMDVEAPEIIVEQYRSRMAPGSKQTFTLSVVSRQLHTQAELLTTMYDAALDQLAKHNWLSPYEDRIQYARSDWNYDVRRVINGALFMHKAITVRPDSTGKPLRWMQPVSASDEMEAGDLSNALQGRIPGLAIEQGALDEVVAVGYGATKKSNLTGSVSVVQVRGLNSFAGAYVPLIIVDGLIYEKGLDGLDPGIIADAVVLKGADATAIYGSRAANGVVVISTQGKVQFPAAPEQAPPAVIRKNFSETAFFFPQVHAGKDGLFRISFTMPESVTEWNWKMMVTTLGNKIAMAEKKVVTQLPLMIQPAMPRFLYQGDKTFFKSRITNLDTLVATGKVTCVIEDMVTGEEVTAQVLQGKALQPFQVAAQSNGSSAFAIQVPEGWLHPLKVRIAAVTPAFTDGEEHVIPILAKKVLATTQVPFVLKQANDTTIVLPALPADATPYGVGLSITPKPQAALLHALPYLAQYPYGCAEQTFNKMLAHAVALRLVQKDTALQVIAGTDKAALADMPDAPDEALMPWLRLSNANRLHQQQLVKLLDTVKAHEKISEYIHVLQGMLCSNGGISWFKGGESSEYISCYLLAGLGQLKANGVWPAYDVVAEGSFWQIVASLVKYCDEVMYQGGDYWFNWQSYLYARSWWLQQYPVPAAIQHRLESSLATFVKEPHHYGAGEQAHILSAMLRYSRGNAKLRAEALDVLSSLRERAIADPVYGVRWKELADADDLTNCSEEWMVKLAEAFEASGEYATTVDGIIQWLLQAKYDHQWSTTKATGDAVSLLVKQRQGVVAAPVQLQAQAANGYALQVTDNVVSGQLYAFDSSQGKALPATVTIRKTTGEAAGVWQYYYFTAQPPVSTAEGALSITRSLQRFHKTTGTWQTITNDTVLHIADKIRVTLTIQTSRQLKYAFVEDYRAACMEPSAVESGYQYGNGFGYYLSVRDASMQFFAEKIPAGLSALSYECVINRDGNFHTAPATLQCMYQPQMKAYSNNLQYKVVE